VLENEQQIRDFTESETGARFKAQSNSITSSFHTTQTNHVEGINLRTRLVSLAALVGPTTGAGKTTIVSSAAPFL